MRLLKEVGYRQLSVEAIAAEAGVAKTTVYRRYRNKADLATNALASTMSVVGRVATSDDPRGDLVAFLRQFEASMGEVGVGVISSLLGDGGDSEFLELHRQRTIRPCQHESRRLLQRAQALELIRADADLDLVMEMLIGSVIARHLSGRAAPAGWPEAAVATLWEGLRI